MRGHLKCTCHPDGTTATEMIIIFEKIQSFRKFTRLHKAGFNFHLSPKQ